MKLIVRSLFVCLSLVGNIVFSQDVSAKVAAVEVASYNSQQLDSVLMELRKEFYKTNYERIIEQVPKLIKHAEQENDFRLKQRLISILGNSFIQLDEIRSAYELFTKSLEDAKKSKNTFGILSSYINLGNTYIFKDPEKAIAYFTLGTEYIEQINTENRTNYVDNASFILYNNLAELYIGIKKPNEAQIYLGKAQSLLDLPSLKAAKMEYKATGHYIQGAIDLLQNQNESAIENALRAMEMGKDILGENYKLKTYKVLIDAYANLGEYEELNAVRIPYDSLRDRRYEAEKIRQQQIASSKFNLESYKQQLSQTRLANELSEHKASKNQMLFIFTTALLGVLLFFISILLYGRHKRNRLLSDLKEKNRLYLDAKEVSEKLARSNTRFLSTISHELRTPLYGIIGLSSVLLKNDKLDEKSLEEIKSLKFSADYLLALVNDVLHINKFESEEGQKVQNDHFILSRLIDDIVQSFEFNNKKNNNIIHIAIDSKIPQVLQGDKMKLSQVLMNLISNASKFTEDGDIYVNVVLKSKCDESIAVGFAIKDTGVGIPLEEQEKIFDEFTQVKRTNSQDGTGLGLPIVNKILHILGSKLQFESKPGEGTTFSFTLELKEGAQSKIEHISMQTNYDSLKGKKVLIVDDNKINQLVTQKVLALYEIHFEVASDGLEAVEKTKHNAFDALLMDINMPNMNGFEASKEIRTFNKVVPIIALTATNYEAVDENLSDFGIDDTVVKPYDTEMLLKVLVKHVHLQKRYPFDGDSHFSGNNVRYSG